MGDFRNAQFKFVSLRSADARGRCGRRYSFWRGASFGTSASMTSISLPPNSIVAVVGACPTGPGWKQVAKGQVIVGAGTGVKPSGGNPDLITNDGITIGGNNIPEVSTDTNFSASISASVPYMKVASGDKGNFFGDVLFNNNGDINLYGRAGYHGPTGTEGIGGTASGTAHLAIGNKNPTPLRATMPYMSVPLCQAPGA